MTPALTAPDPPPADLTPLEQAEADRMACLLGLALLARRRPTWRPYLRGVARELFNGALEFDELGRLNADCWAARQT